MRVFVHVVGEADVGLDPRKCRPDIDLRNRTVAQWRNEVLSIESRSDLVSHLRRSRVIEPDGSLTAGSAAPPPLVGLLDPIDRDEDVELVLVGTENDDGVPSLNVAETLRILLDRHDDLLGPHVWVRVAKSDFDMNAVAATVRSEMRENDPANAPLVEVLWGSGSTEIGMAVISGVIASGRRWMLRSSRHPFPSIDFLPYLDYPASVAWLLRYGYPERVRSALGPRRHAYPQIGGVADAAAHTQLRVAKGSTSPEDLAGWVRMDARRRNRTSGLAVRAWITAEYRRRSAAEGTPDVIDLVEGALNRPNEPAVTLGTIIAAVRDPSDLPADARRGVATAQHTTSGRWLMAQQVIASVASDSAHEFRALKPGPTDRLRKALNGAGELGPMEQCGPFHLPTGIVAFVWGDGRTEPGRVSTMTTVTQSAPPQDLLDYVPPRNEDGSSTTLADLLILATNESEVFAREQAAQAAALPPGPYRFVATPEVAVTRYLVAGRQGRVEVADDAQESARAATERWLTARDVDAVVVVPTAPKQQVAGILNAVLAYGHRRAVPVFVLSIARNSTEFHQFVPYLVTNEPLLELALASLRSLAFDSVTTLIGLCEPPPDTPDSPVLDEISDLSRGLAAAFFVNNGDRARERIDLCATLVDGASVVDQVRLAHVAAEIYIKAKPRKRRFGSRLVEVRNALTVNHGEGSLTAALDAAATALRMPHLKLGGLIRRAAAETGPAPTNGTLTQTYQQIDTGLRGLLASTRSVDNKPVRPAF